MPYEAVSFFHAGLYAKPSGINAEIVNFSDWFSHLKKFALWEGVIRNERRPVPKHSRTL